MSNPIAVEAPASLPVAPAYQCRHVFSDGHRCGSRALRKENFCYYHHSTRRPAGGNQTYHNGPEPSFDLPFPEDRAAIQRSIGEVIRRIASDTIGAKRAGLLLYAFQIASSNLPKPEKSAIPVVAIDEIIHDPTLGDVAPIAEFIEPPHKPTLADLLLETWQDRSEEGDDLEELDAAEEPVTLTVIQAVEESQPPLDCHPVGTCFRPSSLAGSCQLENSQLINHAFRRASHKPRTQVQTYLQRFEHFEYFTGERGQAFPDCACGSLTAISCYTCVATDSCPGGLCSNM